MTRAQQYDRETALTAAMSLFWQKGYHATSLKDLEGALQMKPGSIYAAFKSKENLFLLTLERYFSGQRKALREGLSATGSPLSALAAQLRSYGHRPRDADPMHRSCMLVKTMLGATPQDAKLLERAGEYLDGVRAEITAGFERAIALGELPINADAQRLGRRFQANITALRFESHRGLAPMELAALADDMADEIEAMRVTVH